LSLAPTKKSATTARADSVPFVIIPGLLNLATPQEAAYKKEQEAELKKKAATGANAAPVLIPDREKVPGICHLDILAGNLGATARQICCSVYLQCKIRLFIGRTLSHKSLIVLHLFSSYKFY
jgi:hypothetical protein